uniref:PDZ domain-containing protein n=1 Tax=Plectus sambesii TaxID=2011161 RepID=A0A914XAD6_9BILA
MGIFGALRRSFRRQRRRLCGGRFDRFETQISGAGNSTWSSTTAAAGFRFRRPPRPTANNNGDHRVNFTKAAAGSRTLLSSSACGEMGAFVPATLVRWLVEVSLRRSTSCDRLGLTLCYGAIDEEDTDIFISEVERNSVADRDGRVRPGDQILQINNADVHTRNEAIELFRRSGAEITLLLARAVDDATLLTDVPSSKCLSPMPEQQPEDDDQGALTDANSNNSAHEKDSGISRTTDSEPELLPPPIKSPDVEVSPTAARCALAVMESGGGGSSSATQTPTTDVATTCKTTPTTPHADGLSSALSSPGSEAPPFPAAARRMARSDSDGSLERELASLHREMETIRIECDRLISKHATAERRVAEQVVQAQSLMLTMDRLAKQQVQSPPHGQSSQQPQPRAGYSNQPEYLQQQQQLPLETNVRLRRDNNYKRPPVEDTSSAYNTGGESCRSTPMKADYAHVELRRTAASNSSPFRLPQYSVALPNQPSVPLHHPYQSSRPLAVHEPVTSPTTTLQPGDTLYTSPAHLAQTITLQQRLLRQAMIQQAQLLKQHGGEALLNGPVQSNSLHQALGASEELNCEWKVKRRSDGSRYITKRPVRNRLLREREEQLKNERVGVSTDDDAMSELKIGRFWTREERKKHLEKARERKLRQQELLRRKAASLGQPSDQMIVQLSQKKMMRRKGQQLFDKFTTIQEFLAHGNRVGGGSQAFGGILSVTTV